MWPLGDPDPVVTQLAAVAFVGLALVGVLVAVAIWLATSTQRSLRRLGYKRQPNGSYTRVVGEVRVAYETLGRWTVRTGMYAASDFVAEPRRGSRDPGEYTFECGDDDLDRRFWFWSERPPYTKLLLQQAKVKKELLALPPAAVITLRGDELVVVVKRGQWPIHNRVIRLARAIASAARPG